MTLCLSTFAEKLCNGILWVEHKGKCFHVGPASSYSQSQTMCNRVGAHLLIIRDYNEWRDVDKFFSQFVYKDRYNKDGARYVYIGLTREKVRPSRFHVVLSPVHTGKFFLTSFSRRGKLGACVRGHLSSFRLSSLNCRPTGVLAFQQV